MTFPEMEVWADPMVEDRIMAKQMTPILWNSFFIIKFWFEIVYTLKLAIVN